jgi:hypothetical protein
LLAFGGQPVQQQRIVELAAARADLLRIGGKRCELIVEDRLCLVQQTAEQRRFAIVDAPARDQAQQILAALGVQVGLDFGDPGVRRGDQKYPSCFFFSIEAD